MPWGLLITTVLFFGFGLLHLSLPGPYGDEVIQAAPAARVAAWTIPAANGPIPTSSIVLFGHVWPFMTLPYLGPIKTYILALSFSIFGPSIEVTRATTLTGAFIGLVFLYLFARSTFNRLTAELSVILVGLDPSFLVFARDDWGPVAFAFAAKMAGLYFFARWWRRPRRSLEAILAGFAFGTGLSHKADFAWLLLAGLPVSLIAYRGYRRAASVGGALLVAGFIVGAAPLLYYNVRSGWLTWSAPGESLIRSLGPNASVLSQVSALRQLLLANVSQRWAVLSLVLAGRGVTEYIVGPGPDKVLVSLPWRPASASFSLVSPLAHIAGAKLTVQEGLLILAVSVAILASVRRSSSEPVRLMLTCLAMAGLVFAQIAVTPAATGPHHSIAVYPFTQLMISYGISLISYTVDWHPFALPPLPWRSSWIDLGRALIFFVPLGLVLIVSLCDLGQLTWFEQRLAQTGGHGYWSDAIDAAAAYLEKYHPDQYIETLDWGLRDQLIILFQGNVSVGFWGPGRAVADELKAELAADRHVFVLHTPDWTLFKDARTRFISQLSDPHLGPVRIREFRGHSDTPSVVVVEIPRGRFTRLIPQLGSAEITPPSGDVPAIGVRRVSVEGVTQEALLAHLDSKITYRNIQIPPNSRLVFATAIDPTCSATSAGAKFEVDLRAQSGKSRVFLRSMEPRRNSDDRAWLTGWVDLDPWAHERVDISFVTAPVGADSTCAWALWADPVLGTFGDE